MFIVKVLASVLLIMPFASIASAKAGNEEVKPNEENCRIVDGYNTNTEYAIAKEFSVPVASVKFLGAKWVQGWLNKRYSYRSNSCIFYFDTAAGPKECLPHKLLTDDGGKTTFGLIAFAEVVLCQ